MRRLTFCILIPLFCLALGVHASQAVPILQLYIEGATYDSATESWHSAL